MGDDTLTIETVRWRENVQKTLASIDARTAAMEATMGQFVTTAQMERTLRDVTERAISEHSRMCDIVRQNERLKSAKSGNGTNSWISGVPVSTMIRYALIVGALLGSFAAGLQLGG